MTNATCSRRCGRSVGICSSLMRFTVGLCALSLASGCDKPESAAALAPVASAPQRASVMPASRPSKPGLPAPLETLSGTPTWPAPTVAPGAAPIAVRAVKEGDRLILWGWGTLPGAHRIRVDLRFFDDDGIVRESTSVQLPFETVAGQWFNIGSAGRFEHDRVELAVESIVSVSQGLDVWRAPAKPSE
jgi:hypothetical protein